MAEQNTSVAQSKKQSNVVIPSNETFVRAFKLSLRDNKPVLFYFYIDSLKGNVCIKSDGEDKIIYKDEEEYTTPIIHPYRSGDELIMVTENSIYIISTKTPIK